jgi:hypothetical protein
MNGLDRPVRVRSAWRRRGVRRELQHAIDELAGRAERAGATVWRVQPVVEICPAEHYPAWRQARERTWRRERTDFHTRTWPERLTPTAIAGVLLPQSHGGHYRGRPAEIAMPVFSHSPPPPTAKDFQQPYEPLVLGLIAGWARMALADPAGENAVLLAPPLVDLIGTRPQPRIPHELGISWPLEPSKPHINPARRHGQR